MARQPALAVDHVVKTFRGKPPVEVLKNVSLRIAPGEFVGLLGPNGAGKSTLIHIVLGVLRATSGTVSVRGFDVGRSRSQALQHVGYANGYGRMPGNLTVRESLMVFALLQGVPAGGRESRIEEALSVFQLAKFAGKLCDVLSAGQATRVMLAKAFLGRPALVLLDEPTAALDPEIAVEVRAFLLALKSRREAAVLYTSHNMDEVAKLCDRVVFLQAGRVIADDTPERLVRTLGPSRIRLLFAEPLLAAAVNVLSERVGVISVDGGRVECEIEESEIAGLTHALVARGCAFTSVDVRHPTLEEYFLKVAKGR